VFHDKNLQTELMSALAFDLNAPACKLALLVQWYKARGERTLPVQYLKRLGFTRRQWELATKGSREYDGRKLVDPRPAKDGCEAIGLISEYKEICEETGRPKTYWVIGEIDEQALTAIREQRQQAAFDVIEDARPKEPEQNEPLEPSVKPNTAKSEESEYDRGYAHGQAHGYAEGVADTELKHKHTRCVKDASLVLAFRKAPKTHLVERGDTDGFTQAVRTNFAATGVNFCEMVHHRNGGNSHD